MFRFGEIDDKKMFANAIPLQRPFTACVWYMIAR